MRVECVGACDAELPGGGHRADRTRALWPGVRYDLPDGVAGPLIASGKVRAILPDPGPGEDAHLASRPQGRKR